MVFSPRFWFKFVNLCELLRKWKEEMDLFSVFYFWFKYS
uniref:Uncharacterized protein n=1 Tax=Rhizophora mucronata TaxID=61149 RepID=A0A2P2PDQ0_RHIMU